MIMWCWRPTPESLSSSWTSSRRHGAPLIAYSDSPLRKSVRVIVISAMSTESRPEVLSIVRLTSARPRAGRDAVPAKMTSSIFWLRSALGPWAPSTHVTASTTFDFPEPFGPTTTVTPGSNSSHVGSANDLKPLRCRRFKNIRQTYRPTPREPRSSPDVGVATPRRHAASARRAAPSRRCPGRRARPSSGERTARFCHASVTGG